MENDVGFFSDLFSRKAIGAQGADFALQFGKRLTKERVEDEKRVAAEFDILVGKVLGYQRKSELGVLGTSHLVNSVQWSLIDQGFPTDFSKHIGSQLALRLAAGQ